LRGGALLHADQAEALVLQLGHGLFGSQDAVGLEQLAAVLADLLYYVFVVGLEIVDEGLVFFVLHQADLVGSAVTRDADGMTALPQLVRADALSHRGIFGVVIAHVAAVPAVGLLVQIELQAQMLASLGQHVQVLDSSLFLDDVTHGSS
jgi:hypothetical protein